MPGSRNHVWSGQPLKGVSVCLARKLDVFRQHLQVLLLMANRRDTQATDIALHVGAHFLGDKQIPSCC